MYRNFIERFNKGGIIMRKPERRTIYNNYDLWGDYEEDAREYFESTYGEQPTEEELWNVIYSFDEDYWSEIKNKLKEFFSEGTYILRGVVGRWNGAFEAGTVFTGFMEMFSKAAKDCDYVHIYDENGHLYLQCSHHDGTNLYEIKKLTEKGEQYLENWEYSGWGDKRSERYVHDQIMKRYSVLPHFSHKVYGCSKVVYNKITA